MKTFRTIFLLTFIFNIFSMSAQEKNVLIKDLVKKWEGNKSYTIAVIEAMPEEFFDFKPAEGMKSFQEQISHFVATMDWQTKKIGYKGVSALNTKSKKTILKSLDTIFNETITYLT